MILIQCLPLLLVVVIVVEAGKFMPMRDLVELEWPHQPAKEVRGGWIVPDRKEWGELTEKEKEGMNHIVRIDWEDKCENPEKLMAKVVKRNLYRSIESYGKIQERLVMFHKACNHESIEDSSDYLTALPEDLPKSGICQLITEVYAPKVGEFEVGDDKISVSGSVAKKEPIVDLWDSCYVKQTFRTSAGDVAIDDETPKKKVHCKVLNGVAGVGGNKWGSNNGISGYGGINLGSKNREIHITSFPYVLTKSRKFRWEVNEELLFGVSSVGFVLVSGAFIGAACSPAAPVALVAMMIPTAVAYAASNIAAAKANHSLK